MRQAPLAGRLKFYLENWGKLTQDVNILSIVQGFKILFSQTPFQYGPPPISKSEPTGKVTNKFRNKRNVAIQQVESEPGEFLSNLFLVSR